jgi:lactoylglutathione lyase
MANASIVFDHVHHISEDPQAAASWYVEKLGGKILDGDQGRGSDQIRIDFKTAKIIVRGARPGEQPGKKQGMLWGADHFGLAVEGDFDGLCDELKKKGVVFTQEPKAMSPVARAAFIRGPDGVSIELIIRKK